MLAYRRHGARGRRRLPSRSRPRSAALGPLGGRPSGASTTSAWSAALAAFSCWRRRSRSSVHQPPGRSNRGAGRAGGDGTWAAPSCAGRWRAALVGAVGSPPPRGFGPALAALAMAYLRRGMTVDRGERSPAALARRPPVRGRLAGVSLGTRAFAGILRSDRPPRAAARRRPRGCSPGWSCRRLSDRGGLSSRADARGPSPARRPPRGAGWRVAAEACKSSGFNKPFSVAISSSDARLPLRPT